MNNFQKSALAVLFTLFCATSYAECTTSAVYAFEKKLKEAYDTNNPETLNKLYTNDAVLIGAFAQKPLLTHASRLAYFKVLFGQPNQRLTVYFDQNTQSHVQLTGSGAIASGIYTLEQDKNGVTTTTPIRYMMVYRNTSTGCELIAHHASIETKK